MRDLEAVDRPRGQARPGLHVGWVDAGRLHPDPDLAGPGSGCGTSVTRNTSAAGPVRS